MRQLKTLDAHAGGGPVRLLIEGGPTPRGRGMREKTLWMERHADDVRRMLMLEPRGHRDMQGAMLTEPVVPGSHAGVIFMNADGYSVMAGHTVMAVAMLALTRGLLVPGGHGHAMVLDTGAGTVRANVEPADSSSGGRQVSFVNVPSFVLHGGVHLKAAARQVRADVAFGGAFYAIVDAESVGLSADLRYLDTMRQVARDVIDAIEASTVVAHPTDAGLKGLAGVLFTAPPTGSQAQLRNITIRRDGSAGRSPSATGLSAVMAVLDAMQLLETDGTFEQEGVLGSRFEGRLTGRTTVGDYPAIVPEISGSAWITGEHVFFADPADPFRDGAAV